MLAETLWKLAAWPCGVAFATVGGAIRATSRVRVEGPGASFAGPAVYAHWHRHVPFLLGFHGKRGYWMLVGAGANLEPMASWCRLCGLRVARVSKAGARGALTSLESALERGESVMMAVDGPRGPVFQAKKGCVELARAAQVPIIAVSYSAKRGVRLPGRWDAALAPTPFDELVVRYGEPVYVAPEADAETVARELSAALRTLEAESRRP